MTVEFVPIPEVPPRRTRPQNPVVVAFLEALTKGQAIQFNSEGQAPQVWRNRFRAVLRYKTPIKYTVHVTETKKDGAPGGGPIFYVAWGVKRPEGYVAPRKPKEKKA